MKLFKEIKVVPHNISIVYYEDGVSKEHVSSEVYTSFDEDDDFYGEINCVLYVGIPVPDNSIGAGVIYEDAVVFNGIVPLDDGNTLDKYMSDRYGSSKIKKLLRDIKKIQSEVTDSIVFQLITLLASMNIFPDEVLVGGYDGDRLEIIYNLGDLEEYIIEE